MNRSTIFRDSFKRKTNYVKDVLTDSFSQDYYQSLTIIGSIMNFLRTREDSASEEDKKIINELQVFFRNYDTNREIVRKAISQNEIIEKNIEK